MKSQLEMVKEFHNLFGLPILPVPAIPPEPRQQLRQELIAEEFNEFLLARSRNDLVGIADALADLAYVVFGAALEYGIPLDAIFAEVHRSNMTKLWPDGKPRYRADGKVLKPEGYEAPNIEAILKAATLSHLEAKA